MSSSVVFLGTSAFAVPSLRALAADKRFDVQLVVSQPDRPAGRKQTLTPPPVKITAEELSLKIFQPEKLNSQFPAHRSLGEGGSILNSQFPRPDFLVVVSYGQILSEEILAFPVVAAVNVHASLLPKLRGASPLQHAILQGLPETGVTVQRMVKELDAGPILAQSTVKPDNRETFLTLHDKLAVAGAKLLIETLSSPLEGKPQNESDATFCKKLTKSEGITDPKTMDAAQIDRMVRALTPWPGVTIGDVKILSASLESSDESMPVSCADNSILYVTSIQPAGGKPMSGKEYLRGHQDGIG